MQSNNDPNKPTEISNAGCGVSASGFSLEDRIELFAEGELSKAQRAELFAELDQVPEKWKDLALALVEFGPIRQAVAEACSQGEKIEIESRRRVGRVRFPQAWLSAASSATSIAAAILLAFGLGYFTSQQRSSTELVEVITPSKDRVQGSVQAAPGATVSPDPSNASIVEVPPPEIKDDGKANQIVGYASWVGNYGLQSSPVFLGESLEKTWSRENPPKLNPTIEEKFAKAGVKARPERRFVSLELKDGPLLTIPIDDWQLLRVSREMF